ncbi:hypothetical protein DYB37_013029 [Aphanomyces astaci]|uniref:Core-binding (CB) domain-containing protein n=1 Tax=Aphanomyces astaci TaxID=112090 RepID=A0A3R6ZZK4_APHAT|nr:hypothetical protein DYB35_013227 [Aphanomyces astaci]RHZ11182.1 hypothetical protein DYB37_013029 [Aphanomyces astaci]
MEDEPRNDVSTRQQSITVQDLRDNRLAEGSKKGYLSGVRHVVAWLRESGRSGTINPDGSINLDVFCYEDFTEFVLYKYKSAGVSLSTLSGYRSAIKDCYNRQNVALPAGLVTDATAIYQVSLNATYIMTAPVTNTWAALWLVFHLTAVSLLHYLLTLVLAVTKQFPLPGH